jgi:DNA-binding transcriptional MerR regulator
MDAEIRSDGGGEDLLQTRDKRKTYTITELSREFDVTPRTLRFYEDKGLLNPTRNGQNRIYAYRDRVRLKLILQGKRVGFPLADIKELLDLYDLRDGQVTQLRVSLSKFDERIGALRRQKADIEEAIADLSRTRELVHGMLRDRERSQGSGGKR